MFEYQDPGVSVMSATRLRRKVSDGHDNTRAEVNMDDRSPSVAYRELVSHSSSTFRADVEFHEQPRQILFGAILVAIVGYLASSNSENVYSSFDSARVAMLGCVITIVFYCMLQTKDGLMLRPHPMLWRAVHGMAVCYVILLVVFIILPPKLGVTFLHDMFPDIAGGSEAFFARQAQQPIPHLDAYECEINFSNVKRQITSIWFLAHVLGYFGKMCLLRDWRMCLTYSVAFEAVELSLVWLIPEFQECWWDSVFMDVLGANMLGMFLGHLTLRYLSCRNYDWERSNKNRRFWRHFLDIGRKFTPFSWSNYSWPKDPRSSVLTSMTWVGALIMEFNSFLLIHGLGIRPSHWITTARLILLGAQGLQVVPEWYEYVHGNTERIGHNSWIILLTIVLEQYLGLRYGKAGQSYGVRIPPNDIILALGAFLVLTSLWLTIGIVRNLKGIRRYPNWLLYLRIVSLLPLLSLTRRWVF